MNEPNETIEISGPANGRWFFTQIPDWIALCPDLKDGAFRLYAILRSLIHEKQDDSVRVLTHDQIASLMVGKNGKPSTVSTVKALLRNLEDVGLIEHPDGSRMASPTGRGNPNAQLRYRLNDWPDKQRYAGWRNAYDKLKWYSEDWAETRTDVAGDDYAAWLVGEGKTSPTRDGEEGGEQKTSPQAKKNTRLRRSFSSQDSPTTSGNAPSNKSSEQASVTTSSSSVTGEDTTPTTGAQEKKTSKTPEDIVMQRTHCTPDEARMVVDYIEQQGDGRGGRIRSLAWWVTNREERTLLSDLAHIRRHSAAPTITHCGIHQTEMKPYGCEACAGEIKAGDRDQAVAHLALVGEKARPDLARLLGAPVTHAGATTGGWSWEHQHRAERRHRNGVVGGTRHGVGTQATYDAMAQMSQDELRALMLG